MIPKTGKVHEGLGEGTAGGKCRLRGRLASVHLAQVRLQEDQGLPVELEFFDLLLHGRFSSVCEGTNGPSCPRRTTGEGRSPHPKNALPVEPGDHIAGGSGLLSSNKNLKLYHRVYLLRSR